MNKKLTEKALLLTQQMLQDFHQRKPELIFPHCAEDMTWIGAQFEQYDIGLDAFREDILAITAEMPTCHLMHQEFMVTVNNGPVCVIIGRYQILNDDTSEQMIMGPQRCTAVWEKIGEELKLSHLSTTSPLESWKVVEGENFANTMGTLTKQYFDKQLEWMNRDEELVITDEHNATHFVSLHTIEWAAAEGRHTRIHVENSDIMARMSFSEFLSTLDNDFLQIHRSYAVNLRYVRMIEPFQVEMSDGTRLNIPEKKYTAIRSRMEEIVSGRK